MSDEADLRARLGLPSDYERQDRAEEAWIGAVLRQVGWSSDQVKSIKRELQEAFTWDWFNGEAIVDIRLGSCGAMRLDIDKLFKKPNTTDIVSAYKNFRDLDPDGSSALLFRLFDLGQWIATDLTIEGRSTITIATPSIGEFYLVPFTDFFKDRWDDSHE